MAWVQIAAGTLAVTVLGKLFTPLAVPPNEFFEQHEIMNGCRRIYVYCFLEKKLID